MTEMWRPVRIYLHTFRKGTDPPLFIEEMGRSPCQAKRRAFHQLEKLVREGTNPGPSNEYKLLIQSFLKVHPDSASVPPLEDHELNM